MYRQKAFYVVVFFAFSTQLAVCMNKLDNYATLIPYEIWNKNIIPYTDTVALVSVHFLIQKKTLDTFFTEQLAACSNEQLFTVFEKNNIINCSLIYFASKTQLDLPEDKKMTYIGLYDHSFSLMDSEHFDEFDTIYPFLKFQKKYASTPWKLSLMRMYAGNRLLLDITLLEKTINVSETVEYSFLVDIFKAHIMMKKNFGQNLLYSVCTQEHGVAQPLKLLQLLLASPLVDPNLKDIDSRTLFWHAIMHKNFDVAKALLDSEKINNAGIELTPTVIKSLQARGVFINPNSTQ